MASSGYLQAAVLLLAAQLLCLGAADADQETGTVIPAESRPCVDCHAFEFMQRALQDLKKTAFNLDARVTQEDPLITQKHKNGRLEFAKMYRRKPKSFREKVLYRHETKTETLVLRAERRALCDCMPTNSLR